MLLLVDYFDTLVHRAIPPEGVKKYWGIRVSKYFNIAKDIDIYALRFAIEEKQCKLNLEIYDEQEFRYKDMCLELYESIKKSLLVNFADFFEKVKAIELEIELQVQYLNEDNILWLKQQKKNYDKICLVSDFYLDNEFFTHFLEFHGIKNLFDEIFISSFYMKSKRSGKLYQLIMEHFGSTDASNWVIFGDNKISDIQNSRLYGIKAIHFNANQYHNYYKNFDETNLPSLFNIFDKLNNVFNKVIYPQVVKALYLFIKELYDKLEERKVKDVLFLSREGEYLKKLFDNYVQYIGGSINSHYFFVSRRATFLPSLKEIGKEKFETLFRQYINISIREFLLNLNFMDEQIKIIKDNSDLNLENRIQNFPDSEEFKKLLIMPIFIEFYEENRRSQLSNIKNYLLSLNIDHENLNIVDIGWKGTIQDNLANIFITSNISGYYLGLYYSGFSSKRSQKIGLLFSPDITFKISAWSSIYKECSSLFEVLLSASHGSVKRYLLNGEVELIDNKLEESLFISTIKPVQEKMFDYFKKIVAIFDLRRDSYLVKRAYINKQYADFIFSPNLLQLKFFQNLFHVESFGVHEVTEFNKEENLIWEWGKFFYNPKAYISHAIWPSYKLFLHRLKWLIPLYKAYRLFKLRKGNT